MKKTKKRARKPRQGSTKPAKQLATRPAPQPSPKLSPPEPRVPIVGIGASAGGLEAFSRLLSALPTDTGMAFVFVQHLDPTHPSLSVEILARLTNMSVEEVVDKASIQPNNVYVIPPNRQMTLEDGSLHLVARQSRWGSKPRAIDVFFNSLAKVAGERAVCVVLSGTGEDGTSGAKAVRAAGGVVVAQEPGSAKFPSMPKSIIAAHVADYVLAPEEIAVELGKIAAEPDAAARVRSAGAGGRPAALGEAPEATEPERALERIFDLLQTSSQVDFSEYKESTIRRRIQRRMQARRMTSLAKYADDLAVNKDEVRALYDDLLINVTEFFRDPESFRSLARRVFPAMLAGRTEGAPLRIWVPGCSTGEEAYSIAIALTEYRARAGKSGPEQFSTQIFGTDISERAIQTARAGRYPAHIAERMSKERLLRFFDKVDGGYKVKKAIRDQCLFSRHDLTSDPPFARLDLISCRNVLIYFAKNLQLRVFPLFHYALRPGGFLWLGKSENPGELSKLFQVVDKTHKIYAKSASSPSVRLPLPAKALREPPAGARPGATSAKAVVDVRQYADKLVLAKFSLPGVIVSDDLEILQFRGRAFPYLEATPGQPSLNLLKMARPELLAGLRSALQAAKKENRTQSKKGLRLDVDGESIDVDIDVLPLNSLAEAKDRAFLVLFKGAPSSKGAARGANAGRAAERDRKGDGRVEELLAELAEIKDYHQSLIEQYEVAQAELTSTNEELQSANEELLSANEEIETSKEELQSSNEELITVNDELQLRNSDLTVLGGNLNNLLAGVDIPVLIVGGDYRLKLFSPKAGQMLGLSEASVGLAIAEVATRFRVSWRDLIDEVGRSGCSTEVELRDRDGSWWRAQVRPFRTAEQRIEGATIALVDIDALKQNELRLRAALEYISSVEKCMPIPLVVVSRKCQFRSANPAFSEAFCGSKGLVGEDIFTILEMSEADVANVRALVARAIQENASFKDVEIECKSSLRGPRKALLSIGKVPWQGPEAEAALISFVDVTEQRRMVDERQLLLARERDARLLADEANRAKDVFLATLSHELRTPLSSILTWAQLISRGRVDFEKARQGAAIIEQSARTQGKLIDDLLDVSRAISGKLAIEMRPVDPAAIVRLAIESVQPMADKKAVKIEESLAGQPVTILADPVRLQQILWNILANAVKFSPQAGAIQVALEKVGSGKAAALEIRVSDHGKGIPEKFLGEIFLPFSQADGMSTRVHGGLGLGLSIARSLAELQHGTVRAANAKGGGAVFTVSFPLAPEALARPRAAPLGSSADIATASGESDGSEPRLDGIKALFVDDDANMREAIGLAIVSLGAEVTAVASADEALATFVSGKWDVLLSDIAMPEQDGYALIQRVRALEIERGGCIPSIAITAYATANDARRALASGFHAHIAKPVGAVELGRLILQVIAQVARPALKSES